MRLTVLAFLLLLILGNSVRSEWEMVCVEDPDGGPNLPIASIDLFVVPTIAFQQVFAFVILKHERRRMLWFAVTRNPTAEWLAHQITEAFPWDSKPKYLIRDNDRAFGVVCVPKT